MNDMTHAGIGHNGPPAASIPAVPAEMLEKVQNFSVTAGEWLDLKEIDNEARAVRCTDFLSGAKGLLSLIDDERKRQKKPHDDAAKAVQDAFRKSIDTVDFAIKRVGLIQTAWLKVEKARAEERKRQEKRDADEKARQADRAAREAEARNDVAGIAAAQAAQKDAAKEVKAAAAPVKAQAGSATGAGRTISLRTTWFADVQNINHAFVAYREHPEVRALLERLATADVRSQGGEKTAPQGFTLRKEEKAA